MSNQQSVFNVRTDNLSYDPSKPNLGTNRALVLWEMVPAPVPAGGVGGGGSYSSGGWMPVRILRRFEKADGTLEGDGSEPDPEVEIIQTVETSTGETVKIHPENVIDAADLEALRGKVGEYEKEIESLRLESGMRRRRSDALREKVALLEERIRRLEEAVRQEKDAGAAAALQEDLVRKITAELSAALSAVDFGDPVPPSPKKDRSGRMLAGTAVALLTHYAVPDDATGLKVAGYLLSAYLTLVE